MGDHARAILGAIGVGYLVSRERRIVEINQALCRIVGFERDELLGLEMPWPFTPPEGEEISFALAQRMTSEALANGFSEPVELPLMRKDGTRFMGEVVIAPARVQDGEIFGWVSTVRDVSKRHDHEVELERLATHDPLTGLANRRLLTSVAEHEIARHRRAREQFSVVMLDLDGFKQLNDHFGHAAGDRMLCDVAVALRQALRSQDTVARLGGDEFCVIAPATGDPRPLTDKIFSAVAQASRGHQELRTSIGVAVFPDDGTAIELLLRAADERLLSAKRRLHGTAERRAA